MGWSAPSWATVLEPCPDPMARSAGSTPPDAGVGVLPAVVDAHPALRGLHDHTGHHGRPAVRRRTRRRRTTDHVGLPPGQLRPAHVTGLEVCRGTGWNALAGDGSSTSRLQRTYEMATRSPIAGLVVLAGLALTFALAT